MEAGPTIAWTRATDAGRPGAARWPGPATVLAAALALALGGCAPAVGVQSAGAGVFTATGRASTGHAGVLIAQSAALGDARAFCTGQGRRFLPMGEQVTENSFGSEVSYTVQFRCPTPGSPELQRPTVRQSPDDIL